MRSKHSSTALMFSRCLLTKAFTTRPPLDHPPRLVALCRCIPLFGCGEAAVSVCDRAVVVAFGQGLAVAIPGEGLRVDRRAGGVLPDLGVHPAVVVIGRVDLSAQRIDDARFLVGIVMRPNVGAAGRQNLLDLVVVLVIDPLRLVPVRVGQGNLISCRIPLVSGNATQGIDLVDHLAKLIVDRLAGMAKRVDGQHRVVVAIEHGLADIAGGIGRLRDPAQRVYGESGGLAARRPLLIAARSNREKTGGDIAALAGQVWPRAEA